MHPQKIFTSLQPRNLIILGITLLISFGIVCEIGIRLSAAQSAVSERELEDKIPKHLPIKVKIKSEKEKAFKDMKNEKWLQDFELEVTNTGDKPIYYLSLSLVPPEIKLYGNEITFPFRYGRSELGDIETKAGPDDIPIKPGETYVFKVADNNMEGWERFKHDENWPQPKKVSLRFVALSFGDGTGFWRSDGLAVPHAPDERSSKGHCQSGPDKNDSKSLEGQRTFPVILPATFSANDLPATLLLANFLSSDLFKPVSVKSNPQSQLCCTGNNCFRAKP